MTLRALADVLDRLDADLQTAIAAGVRFDNLIEVVGAQGFDPAAAAQVAKTLSSVDDVYLDNET